MTYLGLFLVVWGGILIGWNLHRLWMAWRSHRSFAGGIEPGDTLELFSADGESEIVKVTAVKRTRITVIEHDTIPHRGFKHFFAFVEYWDDFLAELDDLPGWAIDSGRD